jgi:IS30 family transposase
MLGRSASTISREIKRGSVLQRKRRHYEPIKKEHREERKGYTEKLVYFADTGQIIARNNTGRRGGKYKLFEDTELIKYIEDKILKEKWSPEAITGWLKTQAHNFKTEVCFKTIYNYIDRGQLKVKNIDLLLKVRLKVKKKRVRQRKRVLGRSIDERALEVNDRQEFGHWEGDTVVGKGHKSAILTLVERKTSKGFILPLKDKSAAAVTESLATLKELPYYDKLFKSITFDNGSEFADCHKLETEYTQIYFAHPYSAFERGINENYNGIIRRYIPKGKDMNQYSQADLNRINNQIDGLPRKRLNFKTAQKAFNLELEKIFSYPAG